MGEMDLRSARSWTTRLTNLGNTYAASHTRLIQSTISGLSHRRTSSWSWLCLIGSLIRQQVYLCRKVFNGNAYLQVPGCAISLTSDECCTPRRKSVDMYDAASWLDVGQEQELWLGFKQQGLHLFVSAQMEETPFSSSPSSIWASSAKIQLAR